ncbi:hypothetical protein BLOT_010728 [Blomia tropicalis]|nr:hypothetical protein BLOT_010728 [Blomia tropicalis]
MVPLERYPISMIFCSQNPSPPAERKLLTGENERVGEKEGFNWNVPFVSLNGSMTARDHNTWN